ncbi:MAG: hypothetical protein H0Z29_01150 [Candidatus Marinimicrobia bacterium]|nr:hypothetical protein [Candidatus Neomarinimicrobiota bacterium]
MLRKIQAIIKKLVLVSLIVSNQFHYAQAPFVSFEKNMRIDENTGIPISIYNVKSRIYSGSPEQIARQFLKENYELN